MGKEQDLTSQDDFDTIINNSKVPVIVDFHASWCGPCLKLAPLIHDAIKDKDVLVLKVNVDDFSDIAERYEVSGIPHVVLIVNGETKKFFTGLDKQGLEDMVNSL